MSPLFRTRSAILDYFDNMAGAGTASNISSTAFVFDTLLLQPLTPANEVFPGQMSANTMMLNLGSFASFTNTNSSASTNAWTSSMLFGIYTLANTTQLSLLNSAVSTRAQAATSNNSTNFSGVGNRWFTFHSSLFSTPPVLDEDDYWFGIILRSAGVSIAGSWLGQHMAATLQRSGTFGAATASATSNAWYPFMGIMQTSQSSLPATIAASAVNNATASANFIPQVVFNNLRSNL